MKHLIFLWMMGTAFVAHAGNLKAIVNDVPIFETEVSARMALLQAQQPDLYQEMSQQKLEKVALDNLVDEYLKIQKSQALNVKVSEAEIDQAVAHLERQNGFSEGGLARMLNEQNVPMKTLRQQVYGDLVWLSYVKANAGHITIPDSAVDQRMQKIRKEMANPTFTVAEIKVPTLEQAQDIWNQLQQDAASFSDLAQKYSQSKSAKSGGYVGVIQSDHYGSDVTPVLKEMPAGQLSRPIMLKDGYLILYMMDKKAAITSDSIDLWELAQGGVDDQTDTTAILKAKNCDAFVAQVEKDGVTNSVQRGWTDPYQLPTELKEMLEDKAVGEILGPVRVPQGKLFFMKCQVKKQRVLPTKEQVREQLEVEQMEHMAKRLLNAQKREAVIEYK